VGDLEYFESTDRFLRFKYTVEISESDKEFGNDSISFRSSLQAEQYASKKAVDWLIENKYIDPSTLSFRPPRLLSLSIAKHGAPKYAELEDIPGVTHLKHVSSSTAKYNDPTIVLKSEDEPEGSSEGESLEVALPQLATGTFPNGFLELYDESMKPNLKSALKSCTELQTGFASTSEASVTTIEPMLEDKLSNGKSTRLGNYRITGFDFHSISAGAEDSHVLMDKFLDRNAAVADPGKEVECLLPRPLKGEPSRQSNEALESESTIRKPDTVTEPLLPHILSYEGLESSLIKPDNNMASQPPSFVLPSNYERGTVADSSGATSHPDTVRDHITLSSLRRLTVVNQYTDPSGIFWKWFQLESAVDRKEFWLGVREYHFANSLEIILLEYLYRSEFSNEQSGDQSFVSQFRDAAVAFLQHQGFTMGDVASWAWILSGGYPEVIVKRFLTTQCRKPRFLLVHVLRGEIKQLELFKQMLSYSWEQTLDRDPKSAPNKLSTSGLSSKQIEDTLNECIQMLLLILKHCRMLWAPAVVSVSHMVMPLVQSVLDCQVTNTNLSDGATYPMLCKILNHVLHSLSTPSKSNPYASMAHNWEAQKILLLWAGQFDKPLLLDQRSYRAVAKVLAGLMKSERESKTATSRRRSWPPWHIDQDGMDAQRSIEEDFSRAVLASNRMSEAGYVDNIYDRALKILGGQEIDGTPTIQTRTLFRLESIGGLLPNEIDPVQWTARITATRDVQEAWSAFTKFKEHGGQPSASMYFAMFQKLHYDEARLGRNSQYEVLPGDGLEVLPPSNDNFSEFYQLHLQPPPVDGLYNQMIQTTKVRPSGMFLNFLLGRARVPADGFRYLRDSPIDPRVINFLTRSQEIDSNVIKEKLDGSTLAAFIRMICRFIPRSTTSTSKQDVKTPTVRELNEVNLLIPQPLFHAVELLRKSQTCYRPAWYALFRTLAPAGLIIQRDSAGDPMNEIYCWHIMAAGLSDFHDLGLELDPEGFQHLCNVLEKAILASPGVAGQDGHYTKGSPELRLVMNEFQKMCTVVKPSWSAETATAHLPGLLHQMRHVHLHAYIRVLGLVEDHEAIMAVLEWMMQHQEALYELVGLYQGGSRLQQRVFVAIKTFLRGTEYEMKAEEMVKSVDQYGWDWPSDDAAQSYMDVWHSHTKVARNEEYLEEEQSREEELAKEFEENQEQEQER
jgi:hypothetical protein